MEELSDLVQAAQGGDHEAFARIVVRFQNMAYAGAYAMTGDSFLAQDAAQEAFIDAYLSLGKLREPAAFPGWFRRILIKHSDRQIRGRRVSAISFEEATWLPSEMPEPAFLVEQGQMVHTVQAAVAALPQEQRLVTTLFYVQGYSQKEIAQFLELPVTTIKKRLYTARQSLKERMITMLQDHLRENKPSQSEAFARKVQFFIALRANDLGQVKKLAAEDPTLLHLKTTWDASTQSYYWPLGATPLYCVVGTDYLDLLEFLLSQSLDVNEAGPSGFKPLHHAVMMRQLDAARRLLAAGADANARTDRGHTPLHHAAIRNNEAMAKLLLAHGADLNVTDQQGYTPLDWAIIMDHAPLAALLSQQGAKKTLKGSGPTPPPSLTPPPPTRQVPLGRDVVSRVLDGAGQPLDGPLPAGAPSQPVYHRVHETPSPILETGIKIVDLFAPLQRGGHLGIFSPLSGIGKIVLVNQLIHRVAAFHDGYIIYLGLEEGPYTAANIVQAWRGEFGLKENILEERIVRVFGQIDNPGSIWQQIAETGLTLAEGFRREGHDVLLVVDSRLALAEGVLSYLRHYAISSPEAAITTLYYGDYTVGLEPEEFAQLDGVITFDRERAMQRLYPAVDPLRSYSRLMQPNLIGPAHVELATQARQLFQRYQELHFQVEKYGLDSLFYLEDRQADETRVIRARRLHRFLAQPFFGTEPWTGVPGQYVPLEDTLAGCRAILAGQADNLPEEALYFVGTFEQAVKTNGNGGSTSGH